MYSKLVVDHLAGFVGLIKLQVKLNCYFGQRIAVYVMKQLCDIIVCFESDSVYGDSMMQMGCIYQNSLPW
jgi:hypothetical protein